MRQFVTTILFFLISALAFGQSPILMLPVGHLEEVNSGNFSRDGKLIVTTSSDNTVKIWERETGRVLKSLDAYSNTTTAIFTDDGKRVIVGAAGDELGLRPQLFEWLIDSGQQTKSVGAAKSAFDNHYVADIEPFPDSGVSRVTITETVTNKKYMITSAANMNIGRVIFSEDNRFVLTKSYNKFRDARWESMLPYDTLQFQVFDLKLQKRISGMKIIDSTRFSSIALSPGGKFLVTTDLNYDIVVFDAATGKRLYSIHESPDYSETRPPIEFNPAGDRMAFSITNYEVDTTSQDEYQFKWKSRTDKVMIFSLGTGKKEFELLGHRNEIRWSRYSADGKFIFTASADSTAAIWDANNGRLLHVLRGHRGAVNRLIVSPDGKNYLTVSADRSAILWDVSTGTEITHLRGHTNESSNDKAIFSPDGNSIVTSAGVLWDLHTGRIVGRIDRPDNFGGVIKYSNDGRLLFMNYWAGGGIWDVATGKKIMELGDSSSVIRDVLFHPDSIHLTVIQENKRVRTWNLVTRRLDAEISDDENAIEKVAISPRGSYVALFDDAEHARIYRTLSGVMIRRLELPRIDRDQYSQYEKEAMFSPDEKFLYTHTQFEDDNSLWNLTTGARTTIPSGYGDKLVFASDSRQIIIFKLNDSLSFIDPATGERIRSDIRLPREGYESTIEVMGNRLLTVDAGIARVWDLSTEKLVASIGNESFAYIGGGRFSPDGKSVALIGTNEYMVVKWDFLQNKITGVNKGSRYNQVDDWSPRGTRFLQYFNSVLLVGDYSDPRAMFKLLAIDSTDYLAIDNEGRFDGTEQSRKMLYYTCGMHSIDLDQFKDLSMEPGLVSKLTGMNTEVITAKPIDQIDICDVIPEVEEIGFDGNNYRYRIVAHRGGIGEAQLFVNGKMIRTYSLNEMTKKGNEYLLSVPGDAVADYFASGGLNQVSVKATNREGNMTSRGGVINNRSTRTVAIPNIYILSIGVGKYGDPRLLLHYAGKDAIDFSSAISSAARKLVNTDGREHVTTINLNTEGQGSLRPDKASVRRAMDSIARRATADDIFVMFYAGHGVLRKNEKALYLLTTEAKSFNQVESVPKEVSVSTDELYRWMRNIRANKQVLILDACNSGRIVDNLLAQSDVTRREVPADQQRALDNLRGKTGTFIMAATASGQAAYETSLYGQGILTYCLLSGMKLGGGLKDNRYVDVSKWFNNAASEVQQMTTEIPGARQTPQIAGNASFDIGMVDKQIADAIHLSIRKKIFRRSILIQDEKLLNDDIELSEAVDLELNNMSARGKESPLVYVQDNNRDDTYSIRGRYQIDGDAVSVMVSIFRGKKDLVCNFTANGTASQKSRLAHDIVAAVEKCLADQNGDAGN